jgi:CubicO group peptidase (beta-lactamase class C family)
VAVSIRGEISGVVTLVARNGQIAALDAAGFADIESRKPMRTGAIVQIMSQTKPVTGVAAMILVDEGKLNLTRPVPDYRPEFKGRREPPPRLRQPARRQPRTPPWARPRSPPPSGHLRGE